MNFGDLAARIRNVFQPAEFVKRNDDGTVQVKTSYNRVIDNLEEAFPYGLTAKATKGKATVLCAGGSLDAVRVLPAESVEGAPELEDGDVALWCEGGAYVLLHADGKIEIKNEDQDLGQLLLDFVDAMIDFKVFGGPTTQQTDPSSVQTLTQWKEDWKKLLKVE